mmetsp:Transcript_4474/g.10709  ORF Transcript_4474/g.10709 Transcript_4474/m.10709 type:complete len:264 (+) Transcript_4474:275-1066(+)
MDDGRLIDSLQPAVGTVKLAVVSHTDIIYTPYKLGPSNPIGLGQDDGIGNRCVVEPSHDGSIEIGHAVTGIYQQKRPSQVGRIPPLLQKLLRLGLPIRHLGVGSGGVAVSRQIDEKARGVGGAEGVDAPPLVLALVLLDEGKVIHLLRPSWRLGDLGQFLLFGKGIDQAGLSNVRLAQKANLRDGKVGQLMSQVFGTDVLELRRHEGGRDPTLPGVIKQNSWIDAHFLGSATGNVRIRRCRRIQIGRWSLLGVLRLGLWKPRR